MKKEIKIYYISKKNNFLKIQTKAKLQVKSKSKKFNKSYTLIIYSLNQIKSYSMISVPDMNPHVHNIFNK